MATETSGLASKLANLNRVDVRETSIFLSLRSRCKRKAWGVSPRTFAFKVSIDTNLAMMAKSLDSS
jgi:hypothetical protein